MMRAPFGPVLPERQSLAVLHPASGGRFHGDLWQAGRAANHDVSIPAGWDRLNESGGLHALRLAASATTGGYPDVQLPLLDSEVAAWLEAAGWQLADPDADPAECDQLERLVDEVVSLLADAQEDDGYLNTYVQVACQGERWQHLDRGYELFSAGHLLQAGIAHVRSCGRTDLLQICQRLADCLDAAFGDGPGLRDGVAGHPAIESALVELYRVTHEKRYLHLAASFVERRGHGLLGLATPHGVDLGSQYWQDRLPIRQSSTTQGHVVRQLYLLTGAVDVAVETGDDELLAAAERLWTDLVATKTSPLAGRRTRQLGEVFGDSCGVFGEQGYADPCACVASVMLAWRLLLCTGQSRYADQIERTLYNGILPWVFPIGRGRSHPDPLPVSDGVATGNGDGSRRARATWFRCPSCLPNLRRLLASLEHYVVAVAHRTVTVTQYLSGTFDAVTTSGEVQLRIDSGLPWQGTVRIALERAPDPVQGPWTLMLRDPQWSASSEVKVQTRRVDRLPHDHHPQTGEIPLAEGDRLVGVERRDGWIRLHRRWRTGDVVELELDLGIRQIRADPRGDAGPGTIALERGPLVYCLESVDHPGLHLDDVVIDPSVPARPFATQGQLEGMVLLRAGGWERPRRRSGWWPYRTGGSSHLDPGGRGATRNGHRSGEDGHGSGGRGEDVTVPDLRAIELVAVPYFAWGRRTPGPMRVWLPTS
jgi:DUF1680 family protein